jgi:hypothetical protein
MSAAWALRIPVHEQCNNMAYGWRTMLYTKGKQGQRIPDEAISGVRSALPLLQKSQAGLLFYNYTPPTHYLLSLSPRPLSVLGGGLTVLPLLDASPFPSAASRSKKSCHNSARDSLLLELLAMSMGSAAAALSDAVDGVRLNGDDSGMRRPVELDDVPGRARPACSFCSTYIVSKIDKVSTIIEAYHLSIPTAQR